MAIILSQILVDWNPLFSKIMINFQFSRLLLSVTDFDGAQAGDCIIAHKSI